MIYNPFFTFSFFLNCPVKYYLGLNCPTCGLGRSLLLVYKGDLINAWDHHPLGPILLVLIPLFLFIRSFSPQYFAYFQLKMSEQKKLTFFLCLGYIVWSMSRNVPWT